MPDPRAFAIRVVEEDRAPEAVAFHKKHLTAYLLPRDLAYFAALANEGSLYEVIETTNRAERLVGICYVAAAEENDGSPRFEFGGIYVEDDCRGLGIATSLGNVAIGNHFAWNSRPDLRLIGHVHEKNVGRESPRNMLEQHLGFSLIGDDPLPAHLAPESMERNERGVVVGHLYAFNLEWLSKVADWLEEFDGMMIGRNGANPLDIRLALMAEHRTRAVTALRALSEKC